MSAEPGRARGGALKVALGLALLALVAWFVPWRDRLTYASGGDETTFTGEIHGDWKAERIRFALSDPAVALPQALAAARAGDGELALKRGDGVDWKPGLVRVFADMEPRGLAVAFGWLCVGLACTVLRWRALLGAVGCPTSVFTTLRLTLLGMFFNIVVPGLTGGDLVKAILVAREHRGHKTEAVVSVFVDRLIGILVLAALAAVVIVISGDTFRVIRLPVLVSLLAAVVAVILYVNRPLRSALRIDRLIAKLPMAGLFQKIDEALLVYSRRPGVIAFAVLLSVANHLSVIAAVLAVGRAFGDTLPASYYFALVPIANIVSALPIAPGGWGVGEATFGALWQMMEGSASLGIAISITFRLLLLAFGLSGGLFLLAPGGKVDLESVEREARSSS